VTVPPDASVTDVGLNVTLGPEGETEPVRVSVPLNPLRLAKVIVAVDVEPGVRLMLVGLGLIVKSGTVTVIWAVVEFIVDPLVPLILAV
jgi:hypothetical protein